MFIQINQQGQGTPPRYARRVGHVSALRLAKEIDDELLRLSSHSY